MAWRLLKTRKSMYLSVIPHIVWSLTMNKMLSHTWTIYFFLWAQITEDHEQTNRDSCKKISRDDDDLGS